MTIVTCGLSAQRSGSAPDQMLISSIRLPFYHLGLIHPLHKSFPLLNSSTLCTGVMASEFTVSVDTYFVTCFIDFRLSTFLAYSYEHVCLMGHLS